MIEVKTLFFRAAAECQSTEETRYYLNGVYIHPHPTTGCVLVATDGHRLVSIHDESGKCSKAAIVAIDGKLLGNKMLKTDEEDSCITIDVAGIARAGLFQSEKSVFIDGTFPDYKRVVAPALELIKEKKSASAMFNSAYLASFGKISGLLNRTRNKSAPIRVVSFSNGDPALIRFNNIDYAFGILMPMRGSESAEIPGFMAPLLEEAKRPEPDTKKAKLAPKKKARPSSKKKKSLRKAA